MAKFYTIVIHSKNGEARIPLRSRIIAYRVVREMFEHMKPPRDVRIRIEESTTGKV